MTRIAARTGGDASASSASRTAASPGTVARVVTASARTKKPPAPASRTQRELLRRGELGATATAVADESEDAPAAPLVERDPAVAVGAFVADSSRTDHADHTSNLSVRRLDVKDPAIRTVVQRGWRCDQRNRSGTNPLRRHRRQRPGHAPRGEQPAHPPIRPRRRWRWRRAHPGEVALAGSCSPAPAASWPWRSP